MDGLTLKKEWWRIMHQGHGGEKDGLGLSNSKPVCQGQDIRNPGKASDERNLSSMCLCNNVLQKDQPGEDPAREDCVRVGEARSGRAR